MSERISDDKVFRFTKITQKYSDEIHEAVDRVVDSGWYLQGKKMRSLR